jgi:hypothetical protein
MGAIFTDKELPNIMPSTKSSLRSRMTPKERKAFNESQSFMKMAKEDAIKTKDEFSDYIVCQICYKILGYSKQAFIEALCEECSLNG